MTINESRALWRVWRESDTAHAQLCAMAQAIWKRNGWKDTPKTLALMEGAFYCRREAESAIETLRDRGGLLLAVPR